MFGLHGKEEDEEYHCFYVITDVRFAPPLVCIISFKLWMMASKCPLTLLCEDSALGLTVTVSRWLPVDELFMVIQKRNIKNKITQAFHLKKK